MSGDREVWLRCIPVEEILRDSFRCADSPFPALFGGTGLCTDSILQPRASDLDRADVHPGLHSGTAPGAGAGRIALNPRSGDRHLTLPALVALPAWHRIVEAILDGRQPNGLASLRSAPSNPSVNQP